MFEYFEVLMRTDSFEVLMRTDSFEVLMCKMGMVMIWARTIHQSTLLLYRAIIFIDLSIYFPNKSSMNNPTQQQQYQQYQQYQ